jgi:hypothetical protein
LKGNPSIPFKTKRKKKEKRKRYNKIPPFGQWIKENIPVTFVCERGKNLERDTSR